MKRDAIILLAAITLLLALSSVAFAQMDELKKFEVGAHFSSLGINHGGETDNKVGFGGRFTFNLNEHVSLEAEGDFFPTRNSFSSFRVGGRGTEGLFGVKIGKRFQRFGIFAKARPGFISFSQGIIEAVPNTTTVTTNTFFTANSRRLTHLATDIGGVLEFYPSRRIVTRFDFGDTIIRYRETTTTVYTIAPGGTFTPIQFTLPDETRHNFQFSAGVGFRF